MAARAAGPSSATITSRPGTPDFTRAAHSRVFASCGGSISSVGTFSQFEATNALAFVISGRSLSAVFVSSISLV